jgi:hypothetical protein
MPRSPIDRAVFKRTLAGQCMALQLSSALTAEQRRLLLMINGETPFADLQALVPHIDGPRVILDLITEGLIALIPSSEAEPGPDEVPQEPPSL